MPFPVTPRVVYEHNPLRQVICQLRFPTILEIASAEPSEFQKRLRPRYPLYAFEDPTALGLPKELSGLLVGLPRPMASELSVHKFLTEDSKRTVSLNRDFLALTETDYRRWEGLRPEIEFAKHAFEGVYKPAFYSRIGLRYQNQIDRAELGLGEEPWASLLNPSFLGILGAEAVRGRVQESRSDALVRVEDVSGAFVRLRHGVTRQGPDGGEAYVVDADFYTQEKGVSEHVFEILDTFNRLAGNLFRWAISRRLHDALAPVDIR